jgi:hypothetical protein
LRFSVINYRSWPVSDCRRRENTSLSSPWLRRPANWKLPIAGIPDANLGEIYGADSIQALQLAVDIEPVLKRPSKRYDFYFPTGEGYFDE